MPRRSTTSRSRHMTAPRSTRSRRGCGRPASRSPASSPRSGLNHYAWEVESLATLGALGDVLARNDGRFIWGPGRHGAGGNIYTYHFDPAGAIFEYSADLYRSEEHTSEL